MSDVTIRCRKDGPLIVTLTDHEGNVYDISKQENVALCRCDATSKWPFCDGTHRQPGWAVSDNVPQNNQNESPG